MLTLALVLWGSYALTRIPIDAVPDITNNQVQLITQSPNYSAQEIEQFITAPLELAFSNLQQLKEIRSISRFGISVITIVFEEEVDIYLARQWVREQLAQVGIPPEMGQPEMTPVSTGLGEIYQYVLKPQAGYQDQYSVTELRTIQDWVVKRQLAGIQGVVEINSFGGLVKQYEVVIHPQKLRALDLTIPDLLEALSQNNQNTGGSYIEKNSQAYFIRGEGMIQEASELTQIVIKNIEGMPVLIGDVAEVRFGHAPRYGAMSQDGKGEVVGGIVMMLKGANSAKVIDRVKARIEQVQNSLPQGLEIAPFLDRAALVNRAIRTVQTNLLEGGLIVIFILVIFLGNLRAGLVVASVIPLALLFAIGMMHVFGVSANLMSLGAIDFGLVVDGSIIVVEAILYRLHSGAFTQKLSQTELDEQVYAAAKDIRQSAAFGEIIILIVYLPVLTLVGVEGKMFRPMAQTVSFAIFGALVLSLTYVPAMSAWVLRGSRHSGAHWSDRLVEYLQLAYRPIILMALRARYLVITLACLLLILALAIFQQLGGEFIPQLDEGDFALEVRLPVGSSLSQTIEVSQQMEEILMRFPEVKTAVSKIGTSEIPTDPMPLEANDLMVILKDKSQWQTASGKEALADSMRQALAIIPGVSLEFQQPIEMRFNELLTGVKSDIAVKIYGENLDMLYQKAQIAATLIRQIPGTMEIKVEQIIGLPQMLVKYKRERLAQYGLQVVDLNQLLQTAFAGTKTGVVFEGEKRFDLVLRYDQNYRQRLENIKTLYVPLANGEQIPLEEVAEITYQNAPGQISRDNTQRRITIGVNTQGRDVEGLVQEIKAVLETRLDLPPAYYLSYGGQFENLQQARQRLAVAVPIALGLIFILLYFTFFSVKQAILIFTAIPLAAVGGVLALWWRGMPFSVSAGVGFIALFGVAVLNGLVLIGYFNQLKREGLRNLYRRILLGTQVRLRPVLMTALVASLGFLPMALSTGAGAEVQKPLATVVIGGLISATLLTLVLLPVLYSLAEGELPRYRPKAWLLILLCLVGGVGGQPLLAQGRETINLQEAIDLALAQNESIQIHQLAINQADALSKGAFDLPKTQVDLQYGNVNDANVDYNLQVVQGFDLPVSYKRRKVYHREKVELETEQQNLQKDQLRREVRKVYWQLAYLHEKQTLLERQDTLFQNAARTTEIKVQAGESASLDQLNARVQAGQLRNQIEQITREISIQQQKLALLLNRETAVDIQDKQLPRPQRLADTLNLQNNSMLQLSKQALSAQDAQVKLEKTRLYPNFRLGYFNMQEGGSNNLHAAIFGLSLPLLNRGDKAALEAAKLQQAKMQTELAYQQRQIKGNLLIIQAQLAKLNNSLSYYQEKALVQAEQITNQAEQSYQAGEIDYLQLIQNRLQGLSLLENYLEDLHAYQTYLIELQYITGK